MDELYIYVIALVAVLGGGGYLLYSAVLPLFESDRAFKERLAEKVADVKNNADTSDAEDEYDRGDIPFIDPCGRRGKRTDSGGTESVALGTGL